MRITGFKDAGGGKQQIDSRNVNKPAEKMCAAVHFPVEAGFTSFARVSQSSQYSLHNELIRLGTITHVFEQVADENNRV